MDLYFCDLFKIKKSILNDYGAFNVSLITDLPLFIDPFLLFSSEKKNYQSLHDEIINYLRFLRRKSEEGQVTDDLLKSWYCFSEIRQNWLGFSTNRNEGRGLGTDFAKSLNKNLAVIFKGFGEEKITKSSHLEKLCLIKGGVGRDMISDFTTNLIKSFLLQFTETFAIKHINPDSLRKKSVDRVTFSYEMERWMPRTFTLPCYQNDYVLLTPKDILTKDETWINRSDLINWFEDIPNAIQDSVLRAHINNYFKSRIPSDRKPSKEQRLRAIESTLDKFPQLIDFYILDKENSSSDAVSLSEDKVFQSQHLYIDQFSRLNYLLLKKSKFYSIPANTEKETRRKIEFLKDVIENKGGHEIFYDTNGKPIRKETDLHILFRLTWHNTTSDVSREVNDGRGPADFKISRGASDKTLVEFKLASNSKLKRNLLNQLEIYQKASDANFGFKVIFYFTDNEFERVKAMLRELKLENNGNIYLVDARQDNKPSASNA